MLFEWGKAYSQDLRARVFAEADDGAALGEIATILWVSVSYVSKVLNRRRRTGETTARPQRCQLKPKLAALYEAMTAWVRNTRMRRSAKYRSGWCRPTKSRRAAG